MTFSPEETWSPCADAAACPCPNHLADSACLSAIFSDVIDQNSPLHPILFCNGYLSPAEDSDLIESSIADLQLKITAADNAARNLRKWRTTMSSKIDRELERLELHGDALASAIERRKKMAKCRIRRLPSEVLAHILFLTIDFPLHVGKLLPFLRHDPLGNELMKFERVSKNWRECILSHPILWSRILIVVDRQYYSTIPDSMYAARLARQIERSRQARLGVCITMCSIQHDVRVLPNMVGHLLAPIMHRIQSLHLLIPEPLIRGLHPLRKSFQALNELYIRADNVVPSPPSDELADLFVEAPNLVLYKTRNVADPRSFGIPWPQITRYSSSSSLQFTHFLLESRSVLGILSAASSLQEATFRDMIVGSPPAQIVFTSIVCARLVSLTLALPYYSGTHPIRQVFELCSFPVLAHLDVETAYKQYYGLEEYDTSETFQALVRCIQRSRSRLCTLRFDHAHVASADVTDIFRTVPSLEDVRLTRILSGIDSDVIQGLCVRENGVILLPRLRSLHLDGHLTFALGLFVQMVKGRWDAAPLIYYTGMVRVNAAANKVKSPSAPDSSADEEAERIRGRCAYRGIEGLRVTRDGASNRAERLEVLSNFDEYFTIQQHIGLKTC